MEGGAGATADASIAAVMGGGEGGRPEGRDIPYCEGGVLPRSARPYCEGGVAPRSSLPYWISGLYIFFLHCSDLQNRWERMPLFLLTLRNTSNLAL